MIFLVICDKFARILYTGNLYLGSNVDFGIFKKELMNLDYNQLKVWVDLGFLGINKIIKNAEIHINHKSSKNTGLTEEKKQENKKHSNVRIIIENAIAGMKRYYILRNELRFKKPIKNNKLKEAVQSCAALWNFKRGFKVDTA